jgi:hypothetical protein
VDFAGWLAALRVRYAAHDHRLEAELLVFDDNADECRGLPAAAAAAATAYLDRHNRTPHSWRLQGLNDAVFSAAPELRVPDTTRGRSVDGHLEFFPSFVVYPETTFAWEFVYVVDLERETFTCRRRWPQRWLWPLGAIPRGEAYHAALRQGENVKRLLWHDDRDLTAAALASAAGNENDAGDATDGADAVAMDNGSRVTLLDDPVPLSQLLGGSGVHPCGWAPLAPDDLVDPDSAFAASHSLRQFLFQQLVSCFRHVLGENVIPATATAGVSTGTKPADDFMYREFAFAVLSIAAGEYSLVDAHSLSLYERHDVSLSTTTTTGEDGSEKVVKTWLPSFGSGVHKRGVAPGCAPNTSMYWFENVLVSVVAAVAHQQLPSGADLVTTINAARAFARRTRPRMRPSESFHGVVFSLPGIVLYRARIDSDDYGANGNNDEDAAAAAAVADAESAIVTVSDYLPLLPAAFLVSHYTTRLPWGWGAFAALMHHFDSALPPVCTLNCGALPDELLERVLDAAAAAGDWRAYSGLAAATPALKRYARRRVLLHDCLLRRLGEWVHPRRADKTLCDGLFFTLNDDGPELEQEEGKESDTAEGAADPEERYLVPLPFHHFDWRAGRPDRRLLHLVLGGDPQRLCLVAEVGAMIFDTWSKACLSVAF